MNKLQDSEVRHMAVFKLCQAERQLIQLEGCTNNRATRISMAAARAALRAASKKLRGTPLRVIVTGDDEAHLAVG